MVYWLTCLLNLIFLTAAWAEGLSASSDAVVNHLQKRELQKKLADSQIMQDCQKKMQSKSSGPTDANFYLKNYQNMGSCFKSKIDQLSAAQLKKLQEDLESQSFYIPPDKSGKKLSQYFSQLINEAFLLRAGKDANAKQLNYLNHKEVTRLYGLIITQQFYSDLSYYCLKVSKNKSKDPLSINALLKKDPAIIKQDFNACVREISTGCRKDSVTTSKEACAMNRRLRDYKRVSHAIDTNIKNFEKWAQENPVENVWKFVVDLSSETDKYSDKRAESLLTHQSSSRLVDELYGEKENFLSDISTDFDKQCLGQKVNSESCEQLLDKGSAESLTDIMMNQELQFLAQEKIYKEASSEELKGQLKNDPALTSLITEEERKRLLESSDPEEIRRFLVDHLAESKAAINAMIKNKLTQIGLTKDQQIQTAQTQLKNISQELKDRPEELRALTFYANVISTLPTLQEVGSKERSDSRDASFFQSEFDSWKKNTQLQSKYGNAALNWLEDFSQKEKLDQARSTASTSSAKNNISIESLIDSALNFEP